MIYAKNNMAKVVNRGPMYPADSVGKHLADLLNGPVAAPTTPEKQKLQQMLTVLDYSKFEEIDSQCRQDNYLWGKQPLLKYTKEALAEYARLIYHSILPHFDTMTLTEEQYIALWISPYTELQAQLASKADSFISQLHAIANNPITVPNIIVEPKYDIYVQIKDFLDGNDDFYVDLNDFLLNTFSPLCKDSVTDPRITALIAEINALRNKYNKKLEAFAFKHFDFIEGTDEIHIPTKTKNNEIVYLKKNIEKISYKVPADKILYGKEMRRCRNLVKNNLNFCSLRPKTVAMLTAHKDKISASDWATISLALESKVLSANTRKVIAANLKAIRDIIEQASAPVIAGPVDTIALNDVFISNFVAQLESAYAIPVIKDPKEPPTAQELLDDAYTALDALDALYNAHTQGVSSDTVQAQQSFTEAWYSDFTNIRQSLTVCLQVTINKLLPKVALSDEALSHGAIQGMLEFAKQLQNPNVYAYNYTRLAQELRHSIQTHTNYYTEATPLPQLVLMDKEQLIDAKNTMTAPVLVLPSLFDLTPPIQKLLDYIKANVVTTGTTELLLAKDIDIQSLVPVPDVTIKEIATMLTGEPSTPYLLDANGDLIFHIDGTGNYVKPMPTIADGNYEDKTYHFRTYNWNTLNNHIHDLQQLLKKIPEYIEWQNSPKKDEEQEQEHNGIKPLPKNFGYKLLPKDVLLRKEVCDEANALYDFLFAMAEGVSVNNEDMQEYLEQLNQIHSFKDLYINGKRLAAWVYYPEEYRLISDPPVDDATGKVLDYEPDHLDGDPSNNSKKNLEIKLKEDNLDARRTSRPVTYNGHKYPTTTKYCDAFGLSSAYLSDNLNKLKLGETFESKCRIYSLNADGRSYTAIDSQTKVPEIIYNGTSYSTPKAFAEALKLNYKSLNNTLSKARKAGELEVTCKLSNKKYVFYLDSFGNIIKIV